MSHSAQCDSLNLAAAAVRSAPASEHTPSETVHSHPVSHHFAHSFDLNLDAGHTPRCQDLLLPLKPIVIDDICISTLCHLLDLNCFPPRFEKLIESQSFHRFQVVSDLLPLLGLVLCPSTQPNEGLSNQTLFHH